LGLIVENIKNALNLLYDHLKINGFRRGGRKTNKGRGNDTIFSMKIILIRHGAQSKLSEDNSLTVQGLHQAVKLADELAATKINAIYCSPAARCEQTMDEILRVREDDITIHFSILIGPKLKKEPYEKLKSRINLFLDDLKYDHKDDEIVSIFSHLRPIQMALFLLTGEKKIIDHGEMVEVMV
jgi:broad specificity phosphatase PhoE